MFKRLHKLFGGERRSVDEATSSGGWSRLVGVFGPNTDAGVRVDADSALTISTVYACVACLSDAISTLPLTLYGTDAKGFKSEAKSHPLYRVLHDSPNPDMTSASWRAAMTMNRALLGNAYSWISRDEYGEPTAIYPLRTSNTRPVRIEGELVYETVIGNVRQIIPAADILHIPALMTWDGILGIAPVEAMARSMGIALAADRMAARFYGSGALVSGVLTTEKSIEPDAAKALLASWKENYSGVSNSMKTALLEEGMKYQPISIPPEQAQFLQSRQFQREDIASCFRVTPKRAFGAQQGGTTASVEQEAIEFVQHTIRPWIYAIEQELNRKLIRPEERDSLKIKFELNNLLRGDTAARTAYYTAQFNIGAMSINEIRRLEDRNPIEGGDVHFIPVNNLAPLSQAAKQPGAASTEAMRMMLERQSQYLFNRTRNKLVTLAKRFTPGTEDYRAEASGIVQDLRETAYRELPPLLLAFAELRGTDAAEAIQRAIEPIVAELERSIADARTDAELEAVIQELKEGQRSTTWANEITRQGNGE